MKYLLSHGPWVLTKVCYTRNSYARLTTMYLYGSTQTIQFQLVCLSHAIRCRITQTGLFLLMPIPSHNCWWVGCPSCLLLTHDLNITWMPLSVSIHTFLGVRSAEHNRTYFCHGLVGERIGLSKALQADAWKTISTCDIYVGLYTLHGNSLLWISRNEKGAMTPWHRWRAET